MNKRINLSIINIAALIVITTSTYLRYTIIDKYHFDFDESVYHQVAKEKSVSEAYRASRVNTHPPIIFIFYHYWVKLGHGIKHLRLPAMVFGSLALLAAFCWLKLLTDDWSALAGVCLLGYSWPMIEISIQMRGYSLWMLLLFTSLYAKEKALQTKTTTWHMVYTIVTCSALMTHYATAWVVLVNIVADGLLIVQDKSTRFKWTVDYLFISAVAWWFYIDHASTFRGTLLQREMWTNWRASIPFHSDRIFMTKACLWKLFHFYFYISRYFWPLLLLFSVVGVIHAFNKYCHRVISIQQMMSRLLCIILTPLLAVFLCIVEVYTLGGSRHSLWILPSVCTAISETFQFIHLHWGRRVLGGVVVAWFLVWNWQIFEILSLPKFNRFLTQDMNMFVDALHTHIPEKSLILTDECTRHVLDYYLARETLNHGENLGGGYFRYVMGGYEVIQIPRFHFYYTDLNKKIRELHRVLKPYSLENIWIVYLGYDIPMMQFRNLYPKLPVAAVHELHLVEDMGAALIQVEIKQ